MTTTAAAPFFAWSTPVDPTDRPWRVSKLDNFRAAVNALCLPKMACDYETSKSGRQAMSAFVVDNRNAESVAQTVNAAFAALKPMAKAQAVKIRIVNPGSGWARIVITDAAAI